MMPLSTDLAGRPALVLGGDIAAGAHIAALLEAGADVTVASPAVTASIEDLVDRGLVTWVAREADLVDIHAADLVLTSRRASHAPARTTAGSVTLVGGGPGDPGLVTVAGRAAIETADVIVTDRLAPLAALRWARPDAQIIDVAKIPGGRSTAQSEINQLLIDHALAGRHVVRFKGGDNFVFGRGGEELIACHELGIATTVVPGVSSSIAAPALAGIPVTHRGLTQGFTVLSGHVPPDHPDSTVDYAALAQAGTTLVILMGVRTLGAICRALIAGGLDPGTPAAVVADGTMPSQRVERGTVATIDQIATCSGIGSPAVTVIGAVADVPGLVS